MFIVNGLKAQLRQFNRIPNTNAYDDQNYQTINIKCCPYDISQGIMYGIKAVPEATGYYTLPRNVDVKEGDQIIFIGKSYSSETFTNQVHSVLKVQDNWLFNRVENKIVAVK